MHDNAEERWNLARHTAQQTGTVTMTRHFLHELFKEREQLRREVATLRSMLDAADQRRRKELDESSAD